VHALILAGGFGTRLRPLTETTPKSLLPIGNRPFLEHQLALLSRHGIKEATLLTGYRASDFESFVPRAAALGVSVKVSTENKPLGTAGAVRSVLDQLSETTVVFNGDVLTNLDVTAMLDAHRETASILSIALHEVSDATAYGLVDHDDEGRISAFLEKDPQRGANGGWINAGTYVIEPKALADIPADTEWSFEYQVFPGLLEAGERLHAFRSDAYWLDIGTRERYLQAHADLLHRRYSGPTDGRIVASMNLDDGSVIEGPVLLSHAKVHPGAHLGPETSLAAQVEVGPGARVERSVLLAGARVGANAVVLDSIVAAEVAAGDHIESEIIA
jgi:mannose-1-phosphate guanylyltransferase